MHIDEYLKIYNELLIRSPNIEILSSPIAGTQSIITSFIDTIDAFLSILVCLLNPVVDTSKMVNFNKGKLSGKLIKIIIVNPLTPDDSQVALLLSSMFNIEVISESSELAPEINYIYIIRTLDTLREFEAKRYTTVISRFILYMGDSNDSIPLGYVMHSMIPNRIMVLKYNFYDINRTSGYSFMAKLNPSGVKSRVYSLLTYYFEATNNALTENYIKSVIGEEQFKHLPVGVSWKIPENKTMFDPLRDFTYRTEPSITSYYK